MPAIASSAPAKAILFGEHAVVFGYPAIAVPINELKTRVAIFALPQATPGQVKISSPMIGMDTTMDQLDPADPMARLFELIKKHFSISHFPACQIQIQSTIPVGSGLGSGASVSVAFLRALSSFMGSPLGDEDVCTYAFEIEKIHHATPSGIDNTVITYEKPVLYRKKKPISILKVKKPFELVIANSGPKESTSKTVASIREKHDQDPFLYDHYFESIGRITKNAALAIKRGDLDTLGSLFNDNQAILNKMDLSTAHIDELIEIALNSGAKGAKLTGAGKGGFVIALVDQKTRERVFRKLQDAGATDIHITTIGAPRLTQHEK